MGLLGGLLAKSITIAKDLGLVPSTHVRWLKIKYSSSSRGSNNLFWPPLAPAYLWGTYIHTHKNTWINV